MAKRKVRYAVVGLGHFAQKAILPAFRHAHKTAELTAFVSSDPKKLRKLAKAYHVEHSVDFDGLDALCESDAVDAVYLATPNDTHRALVERVAVHGIHVLCEKPLAVTEEDCEAMIRACRDNDCKLMTAYRLHFEPANRTAIEIVRKGKLGEPRFFHSSFSLQVHTPNIRTSPRSEGGGALYDLGVYCINTARHLFHEEPTEVLGLAARSDDERFTNVEEQISATLRFPGDKLATFTVGLGAAETSRYEVVGTEGTLRVEPAYDYERGLALELSVGKKKTKRKKFKARNQIAAELSYFSGCILEGTDPEPSGLDGLADVRVIRALYRSIDEGGTVALDPLVKDEAATPAPEEQPAAPHNGEPTTPAVRSEN